MPVQEMQEIQVQPLSQDDPLQKEIATTTVFLPGEFHGQWSLAGYIYRVVRVRHNLVTKPPPA